MLILQLPRLINFILTIDGARLFHHKDLIIRHAHALDAAVHRRHLQSSGLELVFP